MKKLKILPSIIILILCVSVLAVGIYAVAPASNAVGGTISVDSSNVPIILEVFLVDEVTARKTYNPVRGGVSINIQQDLLNSGETFAFNVNGIDINELSDVNPRKIRFKITNPNSEQVGAYILKGTPSTTNLITTTSAIKTSDGSTTIANVNLSSYCIIPAKSGEVNGSGEVYIEMSLADFNSSGVTLDGVISYNLFIEKYASDIVTDYESKTNSEINVNANGTSVASANVSSAIVNSVIPEGVTTIGANAYANKTSLKTVVMPSTLTTIGSNAFKSCSSLQMSSLPESVVNIDSTAFSSTPIYKTTTENGMVFVGTTFNPYYELTELTEEQYDVLEIPEGTVEFSASNSMYINISNLILPKSLKVINAVIDGSIQKTTIKDLKSFLQIDYSYFDYGYPIIGNEFYLNNEKITELVIPDEITELDYCSLAGLKVDVLDLNKVEKIDEYALYASNIGNTIVRPVQQEIDEYALNYCQKVSLVGDNWNIISDFYNFNNSGVVSIKGNNLSLGAGVFSNISSISVEGSGITIEQGAVSSSYVDDVNIEGSNITIEQGAFSCDVCNVTLKGDEITLAQGSITNSVESFYVNGSNITIGSIPTDYLGSLSLNGSNIIIEDNAFSGLGANFPFFTLNLSGVSSIGDGAFANCDLQTTIYIPSTVTTIGANAFSVGGNVSEINIECEASSKPAGWANNWYGENVNVTWGVSK